MEGNEEKDLVDEHIKKLRKIRKDPIEFLKGVNTLDESDKENPIKKFPVHLVYIRLYIKLWMMFTLIVVPKSRRMRMSWTNIALHVWLAAFHSGQHVAFVSKKEDDADFLIERRAKFILDNLDPDVIPVEVMPKYVYKYNLLDFPEIYSRIQGFPQGADQMRQYTISAIFADEFAFWEKAEDMYSSAKPTLEGGGRFTGVSSPGPGFFKRLVTDRLNIEKDISGAEQSDVDAERKYPMEGVEIWTNKKNRFTIIQIHYTAEPAKRSQAWVDREKSGMPIKKWNQEYELKWESYSGIPVYSDFNKAIHGSREKLHPHLGLPLLRGWDWGLCYSDDTEVMTRDGWKLFKDLDDNDEVATMNPDGFKLEYEKPIKRVCFDYNSESDGEMLQWENQNISMLVTPEHIMPYSRRDTPNILRRASARDLSEQMSAHRYVYMNANWDEADKDNELGMCPAVYAEFMGIYLSEGCCGSDKNRVRIYQKTKDKMFDGVLLESPYAWRWKDGTKGGYWEVSDKALKDHLEKFGKANTKYIPDCIKFGSKESILKFINTYTEGDGHIKKNGEHTIYTSSKRMADDFQECALKVGWTASIHYYPPTESYYAKEDRVIRSNGGYKIAFKKRFSRCELFARDFKKVPYQGKIYCVSVKHHTLYVRRKGVAHWNGNTPACIVCQLQENTLVVIREFVAENMGADRFSDLVVEQCKIHYPTWADQKVDWLDFIDPAGDFRKDTDESTCAGILAGKGLNTIPGAIVWETRRKSVEDFLTKIYQGQPCFKVDLSNCPVLVNGFDGGYRYNESIIELEPNKIRPLKDEHSHVQDALQMVTTCVKMLRSKRNRRIPRQSYYKRG